jgi:hypothetical protein
LVELTQDFDLHFVGSVAKTLTLAVVSAPIPGGGDQPDGGTSMVNPPPGGETLGGGGGPGIPHDGGAGGPRGAVLTETASGGPPVRGGIPTEGAPGGVGAGALPGSEVGGLPFTGYVAWSYAAAGAAMTTAGITLRQLLRRGG